jgi:CspA family cold shock protein
MPIGMVDRYSEDKGFGFIRQDGGKEIRVRRSSINMPGYKTLSPGEQVSFEVVETIQGPEARNVERLQIGAN